MRPGQQAQWLLAVGLLALTNAFVPVAVRPTHTSAFSRGRSMTMINLPRFNFGGNAKGELSVKDVEAVAVNQIRGGSVAAPMMPEMKAPSVKTQEVKLEDRGQTVSSRFRAESSAPLPEVSTDVVLETIAEDTSSIQGASAVIGAVVGLAIGGPLMALAGAALLTFSCTATNEAGDAARGTGKTTLEAYNFVAKVDKKRRFLKKLADWAITVYYKFKRDNVTDKTVLDQTEETLKKGMEVTAELYVKYDVPKKLGTALEKTGELSVAAIRTVIRLNKEYKLTERVANLVKQAQASTSA